MHGVYRFVPVEFYCTRTACTLAPFQEPPFSPLRRYYQHQHQLPATSQVSFSFPLYLYSTLYG